MTDPNRLTKSLIIPILLGAEACTGVGKKAPQHPNIIVIMTDQQSASMMSCTGNKWLRTPAMDAIASEGVRFARAYATNPVSSPSRFSLQTGRYPSEIGMRENVRVSAEKDRVIDLYSNALGNLFRCGGYQTFYGGKVHMPVIGSDVSKIGYDLLTLDERDSLATVCADFLMKRKREDKPFLLFISFINPHDICYDAIRWGTPEDPLAKATPSELDEALKLPGGVSEDEFFDKYCPPLPENHQPMQGELSSVDSLLRLRKFRHIVRDEWTDKDWRMHRWAYMRLTERVDEQIGKVMQALKESGFSRNTVVVFTSDHGDHDGSHKLEHKTILYEEASNIPFIIAYPWLRKKGLVDNEHLISNGLCLLPTLCDIAGIDAPAGLEGRSVLPLTENVNETGWQNTVFLENETGYMVHTEQYKYELDDTGTKRELLVDLKADPGETENLFGKPGYEAVTDSLRSELIGHLSARHIKINQPE
jgi:arylsulfatase A-like enzyme